ncbi:MAG: Ig-like domain-containing protein [Gemmatimonadota bacterium]|nr:Ig-like domain-containing protein [Gemmatimonadota bacterium]
MTSRPLAVAILLFLTACRGGTEPELSPAPEEITISPATFLLELGETVQLQATVRDGAGSLLTGSAVTWSSSDTDVATVSLDGVVIGTGGGEVTISATVDSRTDAVEGSVLPYRVAENAYPVDSMELDLVSDRAEMDVGTYRFSYVGSGSPPTFRVGDVIVGMQGLGFLRRVRSVSVAGTEMTLETDPALLGDILDEGEFGFNVELLSGGGTGGTGGPAGAAFGPVRGLGPDLVNVTYGDLWTRTAPGVAAGVSTSGFGVDFSGFDVCKYFKDNNPANSCPTVIDEFKFPNGTVTFNPSFDFGSTKNAEGDFTEFHGIATGELSTDIAVSLGAKVSTSFGGEATIADFGRIIYLQVGAIPVVLHAEMEIKAKFEATATVRGKLQAGLQTQHSVDVGARWTSSGGWQGVLTGSGSFTPQQPSIDDSTAVASITLEAKATLTPNLNLKFYGVAGPLLGVEPFAEGGLTASTTVCNFDSSAGIEGRVGIALADILAEALSNPDFTQSTNLASMPLTQWQCPVGDADVTVNTGGASPDPDGYTLKIDGKDEGAVGTAETRFFGNLREGDRTFALGGLAENCEVQGDNPVTVGIRVSQKANVGFQVECRTTGGGPGTVGQLEVTTTTSGRFLDPDGVQIGLNGGTRAADTNGVLTFSDLVPGTYTVTISGLAPNCTTGSSSLLAAVVADDTTRVTFIVHCTGGDVTVETTTSGTPPPNTTMSVFVDGQSRGVMDFNDRKTFGVLDGPREVSLTGVPGTCSLLGPATVEANVPDGGSASVVFPVDCPPGELTVTVDTQGDNGGQASYRVVLDGTQMQTVNSDGGSATFSSISVGDHSVELLDVPARCTVSGQNPRTVTAPDAVQIGVVCGGPGGAVVYAQGPDMWTMNPDGTLPGLVYGPGGTAQEFVKWPSWSSDGSQIVFSKGYYSGLWVLSTDDSVAAPLTSPGYDVFPDWSASGVIAFTRDVTPPESMTAQAIHTIDPMTLSTLRVTGGDIQLGNQPDVAPNGSEIVFSGSPPGLGPRTIDIYRVPVTGGTSVKVTDNAPEVAAWGPSFSPDGRSIAYVEGVYGDPNKSPSDLLSVSIRMISGGSNQILVAGLEGLPQSVKIAWSPDGTQLLYNSGDQLNGVGPTWIYLINADGTGMVQLGPGHDPDWRR